MRLVPLGVRGSTPAPGAPFVRYGGHTSCLAVLTDSLDSVDSDSIDAVPALLLDAGTGLRGLPRLLGGAAFDGTVVLTHLHWDHVQGLPFCPALDRPDARVELFVPGAAQDAAAHRLLAGGMSPPHFPIGPDGLQGSWRFRPARPGPLPVSGRFPGAVRVAPVPHKGGVTVGVRVELDGASIAYLPDHDAAGPDPVVEDLVAGVDVLLHDGQFRDDEARTARAYGHSTVQDAMRLADRCGVGRLVLTHHAPDRTDAELDALAAAVTATPGGRPVSFARQDEVIESRPPAGLPR